MMHEDDEIRLFDREKKKVIILCGLIVLAEIVFPLLYVNAFFKYVSADGFTWWAGFFPTTTFRYLLAPVSIIWRVFWFSPLLILLVLLFVLRERETLMDRAEEGGR